MKEMQNCRLEMRRQRGSLNHNLKLACAQEEIYRLSYFHNL